MPSIKQVEAFYWSGQLGSFVAAAQRLNTTQSNISKRIQELEYTLKVDLFDRSRRAIRLTPKGEEMLRISDEMLRVHMRMQQVGKSDLSIEGPFSFGATEAAALTWLPRFSALIRRSFPGLIPISTINSSRNLNQLLLDRRVDLVIGTDTNLDPTLIRAPLVNIERVWVASPALVPGDPFLSAADLAAMPMLGHGTNSVQHNLLTRHLRAKGVTPNIVTSCTSMSALARMVMDGTGITYLHGDVYAADIAAGRMKIVRTEVMIPALKYVTAYRDDVISPVAALVASKAKEVCDFTDTGR